MDLRPVSISRWWLAAAGICSLCSCTGLGRQTAAQDPFLQSAPQAAESRAADSFEQSPQYASVLQESAHREMLAGGAPAGRVQLPDSRRATAAPMIQQLAYQAEGAVDDPAIERFPIEQRTPPIGTLTPDGMFPASGPAYATDGTSPIAHPDEYLFDGGDRAYPQHYGVDSVKGLETEDTVAEFRDSSGDVKISPSNRVAVYAPRFGSVVTVSSPTDDVGFHRLAGASFVAGTRGVRQKEGLVTKVENLGAGRVHTRSRPTGVFNENLTTEVSRRQGRLAYITNDRLHESVMRLHGAEFLVQQGPALVEGMQFASQWNREQYPIMQAHAVSASENKTVKVLAEYKLSEKKELREGGLQLRKVADRGEAQIGDVITFTLHYHNWGETELSDVLIRDNLTPRLEYIPDSAQADRAVIFSTEENGEGSLILKFALEAPLPGKAQGTVSFQCRVK